LEQPREAASARLEHVLVYENSVGPRARPLTQIDRCEYIHNPRNGGTAAAYQAAIQIASERGIPWLLLLDHDTRLPLEFLDGAELGACSPGRAPTTVALVPWVAHAGTTIVSPSRVTRFGTVRALRRGALPPSGAHLSAIASGTVLHVESVKRLMPIPESLWLDFVDHWLFAQLHRNRLPIRISAQVLEHDLSVANPAALSPTRLLSVLQAEADFMRQLGLRARWFYPLRLVRRIVVLAAVKPSLAVTAVGWIFKRRWRHVD